MANDLRIQIGVDPNLDAAEFEQQVKDQTKEIKIPLKLKADLSEFEESITSSIDRAVSRLDKINLNKKFNLGSVGKEIEELFSKGYIGNVDNSIKSTQDLYNQLSKFYGIIDKIKVAYNSGDTDRFNDVLVEAQSFLETGNDVIKIIDSISAAFESIGLDDLGQDFSNTFEPIARLMEKINTLKSGNVIPDLDVKSFKALDERLDSILGKIGKYTQSRSSGIDKKTKDTTSNASTVDASTADTSNTDPVSIKAKITEIESPIADEVTSKVEAASIKAKIGEIESPVAEDVVKNVEAVSVNATIVHAEPSEDLKANPPTIEVKGEIAGSSDAETQQGEESKTVEVKGEVTSATVSDTVTVEDAVPLKGEITEIVQPIDQEVVNKLDPVKIKAEIDGSNITLKNIQVKNADKISSALSAVISQLNTSAQASQYAAFETDYFNEKLNSLKETMGTVNVSAKEYASVLQYLGKLKSSSNGKDTTFNTSQYETRLQKSMGQLGTLSEKLTSRNYVSTTANDDLDAMSKKIKQFISDIKQAKSEADVTQISNKFISDNNFDTDKFQGFEGAIAAVNVELSKESDRVKGILSDYNSVASRQQTLTSMQKTISNELESMGADNVKVINGQVVAVSEQAKKLQQLYDYIKTLKGEDYLGQVRNGTNKTTGQASNTDANTIVKEFLSKNQNAGLSDEAVSNITTVKDLIAALREQLQKLSEENGFSKTMQKMENDSINTSTQVDNLRKQIQNFMNTNNKKLKGTEYWDRLNTLMDSLSNGQMDLNTARSAFANLSQGATSAGLTVETLYDRLTRLFGEHWTSSVLLLGVNKLQDAVRQVYESVVEIDDALTQISIVTETSGNALEKFANQAFNVAKETGQSAASIMNSATEFSRLGYDLEDSLEASKWVSVVSNTANMDTSSATEGLASVLKTFGYDVSDLESIGDALSAVDKKYAVQVEGLIEATQNGGSALVSANNDFSETLALITAANESVECYAA